MEEREEEYQRARERIFAHDVRAVCVGGMGGGGHVAQIFVSFLFMCKFARILATNYHCRIYEFLDGGGGGGVLHIWSQIHKVIFSSSTCRHVLCGACPIINNID